MADLNAAATSSSSSSNQAARIMNQQASSSWRSLQANGYPFLNTAMAQGNMHGHLKGAQGTHMPAPNANSVPSVGAEDFQETKSITLEWKLSNLKAIFDSSRGEVKSRCIKSQSSFLSDDLVMDADSSRRLNRSTMWVLLSHIANDSGQSHAP